MLILLQMRWDGKLILKKAHFLKKKPIKVGKPNYISTHTAAGRSMAITNTDLSASLEDYLEAIYNLAEAKKVARSCFG